MGRGLQQALLGQRKFFVGERAAFMQRVQPFKLIRQRHRDSPFASTAKRRHMSKVALWSKAQKVPATKCRMRTPKYRYPIANIVKDRRFDPTASSRQNPGRTHA